jgi:cobalt-zinc-cadmium efflux system outer membrane protein
MIPFILRSLGVGTALLGGLVLGASVARAEAPGPSPDVGARPPGLAGEPAAAESTFVSFADAVALARTRGYDVLLATATVRAAEADVRTAGQAPNPTLGGGPARRIDCFAAPCPTPWGAFANLSDEGLLEGALSRKRALREDVARRALEAARYGRADVERMVVGQVKVQYVQTVAAQARLELARDVAASLQKSVDVNRVRYPRVIDEGQLARVEQEFLRALQEVDRAAREVRQQQIQLAFLLGRAGPASSLAVDRRILDYRVPEALVTLDRAALLRAALEARPDRRQVDAQVAQTEASVTLAQRRRIPDVSLLVQYQQLGSGDNAPQPPTLAVGASLPLPIFYRQEGEIARAEADRQGALLVRRRLEAVVASDLDAALSAFGAARLIVERYESGLLERARRALEITQVQFNAGSATLTDLLDAQRSYVAVNSGYLAELVAYWAAAFQLEQAVGKEFVR